MNFPIAPNNNVNVVRITVVVLAVLACAALLWSLKQVILLAFAATLVAIILSTIAHSITQNSRLGHKTALSISIVMLAGILVTVGYMFGNEMVGQLKLLYFQLPTAWNDFIQRIDQPDLGAQISAQVRQFIPDGSSIVTFTSNLLSGIGGVISGLVLALLGGIYLAAQPKLYVEGFLRLVPHSVRPNVADAMAQSGQQLKLWLLGQLVAMAVIGLCTGLGLWAIGLPSPLALGVIAGLLEFIPMIGPVMSAIPAVLLAFTSGDTEMIVMTVCLFLALQQLEGIILMPIIYQSTVNLPPALTLFALFALGGLFGVMGILLAAPMTVVLFVMIKKLYVKDTLGEKQPVIELPQGMVHPSELTDD